MGGRSRVSASAMPATTRRIDGAELSRRAAIATTTRMASRKRIVWMVAVIGPKLYTVKPPRQRATGYSHPAVKVFMKRDGTTVEHKYTEHYPPDPTSMIWWLKNRRPDRWRDVQNIDAAVGVYHISEAPMSEEEWIREHCSNADQLDLEAKAIEHDANER